MPDLRMTGAPATLKKREGKIFFLLVSWVPKNSFTGHISQARSVQHLNPEALGPKP